MNIFARRRTSKHVRSALCVVRSRLRETHDHFLFIKTRVSNIFVSMAMAYETQPQVQLNVEKTSTKIASGFDFLDWYPCSFDYLKEFIRPRDDWLVSQYLYDLFNENTKVVPEIPVQERVPVPHATKKRLRKTCGHHRGLNVDMESLRVSAHIRANYFGFNVGVNFKLFVFFPIWAKEEVASISKDTEEIFQLSQTLRTKITNTITIEIVEVARSMKDSDWLSLLEFSN